jgi:hypothetical protein
MKERFVTLTLQHSVDLTIEAQAYTQLLYGVPSPRGRTTIKHQTALALKPRHTHSRGMAYLLKSKRTLTEDISRNSKRRTPRVNPEVHSAFEDLMIH